jgi:hypothetical protein
MPCPGPWEGNEQAVGRDIRVPLVLLAWLARDVQAAVDISHFGI